MFGYLLPVEARQRLDPDFALRCGADLRAVLREMPLRARLLILHGLLRPDAILVGGYTANGHRCCPLTSAVWEATGSEARQWDLIMTGITQLGLGHLHHAFTRAFDQWAALNGHSQRDPDGLIVLTSTGRHKLIDLIEQLG